MILVCLSATCSAQLMASDIDIENCLWRRTGEVASEKTCNEAKALVVKNKEIADQQRESLEQQRRGADESKTERERVARENSEIQRQKLEMKGAEEEARFQKVLAERQKLLSGKKPDPYKSCSELWVVNGRQAEMPCDPNKKKDWELVQEEEEAVQKRKCGKDFQQLRVGMSVQRFEDCYEALSYVNDTVSGGGGVETYRSTFYFIYVKNDRIVGYTRRTR